MPYIVTKATPRSQQLTIEDLLASEAGVDLWREPVGHTGNTVTRFFDVVPERLARQVDARHLFSLLESFSERHKNLYEKDKKLLYQTFCIPKKSGGLRRIDAPCDELKAALNELRNLFEQEFHALHHTCAFAYVKNRSTVDMLKMHQRNQSRWFLKIDFTNFFGSTTPEFLLRQLMMIFPFSELDMFLNGREMLAKVLSLCFLNGGLPQGTPISPLLTNLMMIPIDHYIANALHHKRMVYTRYADDIVISCKFGFNDTEIVNLVKSVLNRYSAPLAINPKKTHYGSSSGNNWCLGLMLNGKNEITIGWRNVDRFKAMCNSYILDKKNGVGWPIEDVRTFSGLLSYYLMVEKQYIAHIILQFNKKYGVSMMQMIKEDLSGHGRA